eukprot:scaffold1112_cov116-Isochrysis_galbana.AAC.27
MLRQASPIRLRSSEAAVRVVPAAVFVLEAGRRRCQSGMRRLGAGFCARRVCGARVAAWQALAPCVGLGGLAWLRSGLIELRTHI